MNRSKGLFGLASLLALLNAAVFIISSAMNGFGIVPLVAGGIWLVFAFGLHRQMRWPGYFAFLFSIAGAIVAYAMTSAMPVWLSAAIIGLNVLIVVVLFAIIWRSPINAVEK